MPSTTALTSSFDVYADIAGTRPATTVTTNSPVVTAGLASQTSRMTRGSAAAVPRTDSLRLRQRLRRSFGPSGCCGSSMTGSPVRPLLAGPLSAILGRPRPHIQNVDGPPCPGGIIPTALPYRTLDCRSASESRVSPGQLGRWLRLRSGSPAPPAPGRRPGWRRVGPPD